MTAWNVLRLPSLFLVAGCLSACSGLKPFPTKTVWEFDSRTQVCGEYQITDPVALTVKHLRDVPLSQCPAVFGFSTQDVPKVMSWARDAQKYVKEHCK